MSDRVDIPRGYEVEFHIPPDKDNPTLIYTVSGDEGEWYSHDQCIKNGYSWRWLKDGKEVDNPTIWAPQEDSWDHIGALLEARG